MTQGDSLWLDASRQIWCKRILNYNIRSDVSPKTRCVSEHIGKYYYLLLISINQTFERHKKIRLENISIRLYNKIKSSEFEPPISDIQVATRVSKIPEFRNSLTIEPLRKKGYGTEILDSGKGILETNVAAA